jgi:hypothetical protein
MTVETSLPSASPIRSAEVFVIGEVICTPPGSSMTSSARIWP